MVVELIVGAAAGIAYMKNKKEKKRQAAEAALNGGPATPSGAAAAANGAYHAPYNNPDGKPYTQSTTAGHYTGGATYAQGTGGYPQQTGGGYGQNTGGYGQNTGGYSQGTNGPYNPTSGGYNPPNGHGYDPTTAAGYYNAGPGSRDVNGSSRGADLHAVPTQEYYGEKGGHQHFDAPSGPPPYKR